ncbi:hypothetical protein GE09DRAFT_1151886 [Coniochaeta sp. 2T2.1]|nr:hypothetical protein GE09DRAFT_1151886 [Coniochaeta sp. 2T2.1]
MDSFGSQQQSGGGRACFTCGQTTHQARDCPNRGAAKWYVFSPVCLSLVCNLLTVSPPATTVAARAT